MIDNVRYLSDNLEETQVNAECIRASVDNLHKKVNLYKYGLVVSPESRTRANQYMMKYIYRFAQQKLCNVQDVLDSSMDETLCASIHQQNVLVIDDVTTSGSKLNEILRALRILNEDNEITVFSLLGRKDLMADSV